MDRTPFQTLKETWDQLGKEDPLWAIMSEPDKKENKWNTQEFFNTGKEEVKKALNTFQNLDIIIKPVRALDFGCGIGRVTQALCSHFEEVHGVDIAKSMVKQAQMHNQFQENCHYHHNVKEDLSLFPDDYFDLVYTRIVLQHMDPAYSRKYIQEFIRVIKPGGLAYFQVPSGHSQAYLGFKEQITPLVLNHPEGFRAITRILNPVKKLLPGGHYDLKVQITNVGSQTWTASQPDPSRSYLKLGNHWLDQKGKVLFLDDARAVLPPDFQPSDQHEVVLRIKAPQKPGLYILELDAVIEGVVWLKDIGNPCTQLQIKVGYSRSLISRFFFRKLAKSPSKAQELPKIEMYCLPKLEVERSIEEVGGKVLRIDTQIDADGYWDDCYYYCSK